MTLYIYIYDFFNLFVFEVLRNIVEGLLECLTFKQIPNETEKSANQ